MSMRPSLEIHRIRKRRTRTILKDCIIESTYTRIGSNRGQSSEHNEASKHKASILTPKFSPPLLFLTDSYSYRLSCRVSKYSFAYNLNCTLLALR